MQAPREALSNIDVHVCVCACVCILSHLKWGHFPEYTPITSPFEIGNKIHSPHLVFIIIVF